MLSLKKQPNLLGKNMCSILESNPNWVVFNPVYLANTIFQSSDNNTNNKCTFDPSRTFSNEDNAFI